jgi:hypothetical protein
MVYVRDINALAKVSKCSSGNGDTAEHSDTMPKSMVTTGSGLSFMLSEVAIGNNELNEYGRARHLVGMEEVGRPSFMRFVKNNDDLQLLNVNAFSGILVGYRCCSWTGLARADIPRDLKGCCWPLP